MAQPSFVSRVSARFRCIVASHMLVFIGHLLANERPDTNSLTVQSGWTGGVTHFNYSVIGASPSTN
jgi:hypothetical protein